MTVLRLNPAERPEQAALPARADAGSEEAEISWAQRITIIWLAGMFILLPVEVIKLPLNVSPVDVWTMMALPVMWMLFLRGKQVISLYYALPMLLILVGSFISTFVAPAPRNSLIVILKEIFVLIWFVTVAAALVGIRARDFHRILVVWSAVVLLHGLVIVAQFLSPDLWQFTAEHLGRGEGYEIYRPSGLFPNANSAAFFQLLGFVPLLLARPSRITGAVLGLILLTTMAATGSMGSLLAFTAGAMVALAALAVRGRIRVIVTLAVRFAIAAGLLGALLFVLISQNQRYQTHLQKILLGRAERSSEGRFDLWERGMDVFLDKNVFLWGVGPENFRVVDGNDNQLHNDFLAFSVERGLISTLGLAMFALLAVIKAIKLFLITDSRRRDDSELVVVVLLAAMVGAFVYSLTHQVFHNRQLWLILGLQEAMYFMLLNAGNGREMAGAMLKVAPGQRVRSLSGSRIAGT